KHGGASCAAHRFKQACRAFAHTAAYDAAIAEFLLKQIDSDILPEHIHLHLNRRQVLRYGENPHQRAALYLDGRQSAEASVAKAVQLHGKELSYINLLDADAALAVVKEFSRPAACIVKHATPCGCAV